MDNARHFNNTQKTYATSKIIMENGLISWFY